MEALLQADALQQGFRQFFIGLSAHHGEASKRSPERSVPAAGSRINKSHAFVSQHGQLVGAERVNINAFKSTVQPPAAPGSTQGVRGVVL